MSEITDKVWNGSVHVRVLYEHTEYLIEAKRVLYFPTYFQQISDFFSVASGSKVVCTSPVWLEYENVPLKWNLPIGLLYDLLYLPGRKDNHDLPWTLSLKVAHGNTRYPSDHIIPFDTDGSQVFYEKLLNQILINALKQSCYVTSGSSRAVMNLSEDDTRELCRAMTHHDLAVYSHIRRKLGPSVKQTRFRIPLKIYVAGSTELFQAPVWSQDENGKNITLVEVISDQVRRFSSEDSSAVYVHGINVDILLREPLLELWKRFRYMDNFLYVVLMMKN